MVLHSLSWRASSGPGGFRAISPARRWTSHRIGGGLRLQTAHVLPPKGPKAQRPGIQPDPETHEGRWKDPWGLEKAGDYRSFQTIRRERGDTDVKI
jgi:hypothetical protein